MQLHDERIITIEFNYKEKNCFLSLYEKDNDGIYKKIKEKLINEQITILSRLEKTYWLQKIWIIYTFLKLIH